MKRITDFIPKEGIALANYKGSQFIDRIGEDVVKNVVASILCGENVRALTEGLTRRRLMLSNVALLITFLNASKHVNNFLSDLPSVVAEELSIGKISREKRLYLIWLVGLTGKSIQNVLRGDDIDELKTYLQELDSSLQESVNKSKDLFGELTGNLILDKTQYNIDWQSILYLFTSIGAQTLAIRGSEKSLYGKLFEKLILGSLLSILGFEKINPGDSSKSDKVFWLSHREDKRESDATLLIKAGIGVRFDIGFIGPGNSEISLDKVSRFEKEMTYGRQLHYMSTIIIVDRIGQGSRIKTLAAAIDGEIIQMSMTYWVKEVCAILYQKIGFTHELLHMDGEASLQYIRDKITTIKIQIFL